MARLVKSLLGGRYKLSGELARGAAQRAWDRWLERPVFIKIAGGQIDTPLAKRRFIDTAQALARIDHSNIESLLDYGATDDGAAYHVTRHPGDELPSKVAWADARTHLLAVIDGVAALHGEGIVHGDVSPHSVGLIDGTARLVDFADASLNRDDLARGEFSDDVHGIAALGFWLLTGRLPIGRSPSAIARALEQTDAPASARAALERLLQDPASFDLETLRRSLGDDADASRRRNRMINALAAIAAAAMLAVGLSSSVASFELAQRSSEAGEAPSELVCDASELAPEQRGPSAAAEVGAAAPTAAPDAPLLELDQGVAQQPSTADPLRFEAAHGRVKVGSETQRRTTTMRSDRFDLRRDLAPKLLVERGIDLTHGRPTPDDDPRLPIVDGPARARVLFEAACARDYGKGCHMLGVQIAEGMVPDDGAGPAAHYRRGCALDYHRSCAALADLARAGLVDEDVSMLDAKACLLAGPGSSYCLPK